MQIISHPCGDLLAIRIRPANRRERPVYIGLNPLTGTYRRDSEGDYHCTEQEVRRMLADSQEEPADSRILEGFTLKDLDLPSLQKYRQRLASRQPTHPWLDADDIGLLELQALVTADVEGYVDNARMRQITNHHASDITKLLQDLVSRGVLIQNGQGRWTQYCLPFSLDTVHMVFLHEDDHTIHKGDHTIHKNDYTIHKNDHIVHSAEISHENWKHLEELALPARINKRLQTSEMESIILRLCKDQWLTRRQISALVERNSDGLRARFLTPMVEHKLLELRYPDKPKRTDQAYRTV